MGNDNRQKPPGLKLLSRIDTQTLSAGGIADVISCSIKALGPLNIVAVQSQTE